MPSRQDIRDNTFCPGVEGLTRSCYAVNREASSTEQHGARDRSMDTILSNRALSLCLRDQTALLMTE